MGKSKKYKEVISTPVVAEPALSYVSAQPALRVLRDIHKDDDYAYLKVVQKGVEHQVLLDFMSMADLHIEEVAKLLHITSRTLRRLDPEVPLSLDLSEKLVGLLRLFRQGLDIFGDITYFNTWLRKSIPGLGGEVPLDLLVTHIGIDIVSDELDRLAYGVYS